MFGFRNEVRNRAMDGLFANFIPKAGHHNMVAPAWGAFLWVLSFRKRKYLGRPAETGLKIPFAIAIQFKEKSEEPELIPSP